MRRGEVWIVDLPQAGGREQAGRRPTAIVQEDDEAGRSPLVVIVPFTSRLEALRFPAAVQIDPTPENGLTTPSIALGFQVTSVDRSRFRRRLGSLSAEDSMKIDDVLRRFLRL